MDEQKLVSGEMPELEWWKNDQTPDAPYSKTFTSFGGADMLISVNENIIGEAQEVIWEERFFASDEYTVRGLMVLAQFSDELPVEEFARQRRKFNTTITYMNETGQKLSYRIFDCLFTKRAGKHSVDDIVVDERYYFKARKIVKLTNEQLEAQGV